MEDETTIEPSVVSTSHIIQHRPFEASSSTPLPTPTLEVCSQHPESLHRFYRSETSSKTPITQPVAESCIYNIPILSRADNYITTQDTPIWCFTESRNCDITLSTAPRLRRETSKRKPSTPSNVDAELPKHSSIHQQYSCNRLSLDSFNNTEEDNVALVAVASLVKGPPYTSLPNFSFSTFTETSIMNAAAKVAGIADTSDPQADPYRDVEAGTNIKPNENASRVSLPLSHQRSFSFASTRRGRRTSTYSRAASEAAGRPSTQLSEAGDLQDDEELEDEIPWGKDHPCYPHLNPHVPMESQTWERTRVIRIKRDWMIAGDLAPTFTQVYPEILDPVMSEERFREVVEYINKTLKQIFNPFSTMAWVDAGMGLVTGWLWDDLGLTKTKRDLKALDMWMQRWNKQYGDAESVKLIPLRRTAYLSLDIQIPDPELGPDIPESEAGDLDTRRSYDSRAVGAGRANSQRGVSGTRTGSNYSFQTTQSRPENSKAGVGPEPAVPQIPGKYLEEAQQQVEKHMQRQGDGARG